MKRKIVFNISSILIAILSLVTFATNTYAEELKEDLSQYRTEENKVEGEPYLNPKWIEWNNLSNEEKVKWNVIPEKLIVDYIFEENLNNNILEPFSNNYDNNILKPKYYSTSPSYSLNNEGYVSPIKNQGTLGLCWAFAAIGAVESNALITLGKSLIFSERQIDYALSSAENSVIEGYNPYANSDRKLGDGGGFYLAQNLFNSGISPVKTSIWGNYSTSSPKKSLTSIVDSNNVEYYVTDTVNFPYLDIEHSSDTTKEAYRDMIKEHIKKYGGVYVGTIAPDNRSGSCYNSSYNMIYETSDCVTNEYVGHSMLIIGWNDTYGPDYNGDGVGDGAWLLKNSWGTSDHPYPYLSYNSINVSFDGVVAIREKDWKRNYNDLDIGKDSSSIRTFYKDKTTTETLKRITFKNNYSYSNHNYNVYVSPTGNEKDKTLIGTVKTNNPGIYSIEVDSMVLNSDIFTVYVESQMNSQYYVSSINVFTSSNEVSETKAYSKILDDYVSVNPTQGIVNFDLYTITENINTAQMLNYKVYDSLNNEITSKFIFSKSLVVNDNMNSKVTFNTSEISNGIYKIETYYNDALLNSYNFEIGYIKVNKISITSTIPEFIVGDTHQLAISVLPANAYNKKLEYESTNTSVATVDENGLITGISEGTAEIIVKTTDGSNISVSKSIVVYDYQRVESVVFDKNEIVLLNGSKEQLVTSILPDDAYNKVLSYESSNTNVATVDENGIVTGIREGTAEITATTTDRSNLSAKINVRVHYLEGNGTEENPYKVYSQYDFDKIRYGIEGHYIIMNDIEFTTTDYQENGYFYNDGKFWLPISLFKGTINGNNKVIKNIKMFTSDKTPLSIFMSNENAKIYDLTIDGANIEGNNSVSTIAEDSSLSTYKNINVINSTLTGDYNGGGLLDKSGGDNIIDCRVDSSTITSNYIGGLVYSASKSLILSSSSEVKIISEYRTGGLIGSLSDSVLMDSYTTSTIDLKNVSNPDYYDTTIGGLIGYGGSNFIYNNYAITTIENYNNSKTYKYTGTLGGSVFSSEIMNCYSSTNNGNITSSIANGSYNNQSYGPGAGAITLDMIKGSLDENGDLEFCSFNNCGVNVWTKDANSEYITSKSNLVEEIDGISLITYSTTKEAVTNGVDANIAYPFNKMYEYSTTYRNFANFNNINEGSKIMIDNEKEVFYNVTGYYTTKLSSYEFVPMVGNNISLKINFNIQRENEITDFQLKLYDLSQYKYVDFEDNEPIELFLNSNIYSVSVNDILPENASYQYFSFKFDNDIMEISNTYDTSIRFIPKNIGTTTLTIKALDGTEITKKLVFNVKQDYDIRSSEVIIGEDKTISRIFTETNIENLTNKFDIKSDVTLEYYKNDILLDSSSILGTGNVIKTYKNGTLLNEYRIIVGGDITGDGSANATDILAQKLHILNKSILTDEYFTAGDINEDGKVNATDILHIKMYILGKYSTVWGK